MQKQFYFLILVLLILPIAALGQEKKYLPVEYVTDDARVRISYNEKGLMETLYLKATVDDIMSIKKYTYTYFDNNMLKEYTSSLELTQITDQGQEELVNRLTSEKYRYEFSGSLIYQYVSKIQNPNAAQTRTPINDWQLKRTFYLNPQKLPYMVIESLEEERIMQFTYTQNNLLEKITVSSQVEDTGYKSNFSLQYKGSIETPNKFTQVDYYNYLQTLDEPSNFFILVNQQPSEIYSIQTVNGEQMSESKIKIKYDYDQAGYPNIVHLEELDDEEKGVETLIAFKYKEI